MATSGNGQNLQFFRVQQDRYQDKKGPWYIWDGGWKVDKSFRTFFISSPAPHNIFTGEPTSRGKLFDMIFIGHLLKLNITFDGGGSSYWQRENYTFCSFWRYAPWPYLAPWAKYMILFKFSAIYCAFIQVLFRLCCREQCYWYWGQINISIQRQCTVRIANMSPVEW